MKSRIKSNSNLIDADVPSALSNNNGVLVAPGSAVATGGRLSAGGGGVGGSGSMGLWQPSNSVVIPVRERVMDAAVFHLLTGMLASI